ncbi:MAG: ATP-binding protein [Bacteroidota bacterium]
MITDQTQQTQPGEEQVFEGSEAFSRTVLESSPDCLKILDAHGRLKYMNFNGLCQMEISDFGALKNQYWWNLWGAENEDLVKRSVDKALRGEVAQFSAYCETAKGTPKWWNVTVSPISSADKGIYQLLSVSRDITGQKETEQKILEMNLLLEEKVKTRTEELFTKNLELENANNELATFNYIVSHDLQEPLRKIEIFSNLILEAENNIDETHRNFSRIIAATKRMRALIHSLHAVAGSGTAEIVSGPCNLNEVIAEISENLQEQILEKKAVIKVEELPEVDGLKVLITQLFSNLIENALKYSRPGISVKINISSNVVPASRAIGAGEKEMKAYYEIKVADNGIGFEDNYKHKIFELFQRLHSKEDFSGTGIGLTICKKIAEKHGGWMQAEGALNKGSVFTVYIPKR